MREPLDPMSVQRVRTPSASYILRRCHGPGRFAIAAVSWLTVFHLLLQPVAVLAAPISWEGDTSATWSDGANWAGAVAPADSLVTDIASFSTGPYDDTTIYNPNAGTVSIAGIAIGAGNSPMTLSGTALSIGGSGIAMATGAGTFALSPTTVTLGNAQTWANNSAAAFAVNPVTLARAAGVTLNFTNAGGGGFTTTTLVNSNGILGPWSAYGGNDWASVSGGSIAALNNATITTQADWSDATANYTYSAAQTLGGARVANTLKYTGGATTTAIGANTLTVQGLMNAGSGTLTVSTSGAGSLTAGGNDLHVVTASGNITISGKVSGTGGLIKTGEGTLILSNSGNDFSGGVTLNAGILRSQDGGSHTLFIGTGTLTLAGGRLDLGSENFGNNVIVSGSATIRGWNSQGRTLTWGGNWTINPGAGTLSFDSTGAPYTSALSGTVTMNADLRLAALDTHAVTCSNRIIGDKALTISGTRTVTFTNTSGTPSDFSVLNVGDGTAFSGSGGAIVGGTLSVDSQNALGDAPVTINYGGRLTTTASFDPTQTITVNAGGTLQLPYNLANAAVTLNSMGTLAGANNTFQGSIPSAGVLFATAAITARNVPASLTGTLAFGGTGALTLDGTGAMDLGGADRTLAFNASAATTFTDGLTLNANLTVAGTGSSGMKGLYAGVSNRYTPSSNLGTVVESGGARMVTVAMAPCGVVAVPSFAAMGWTGGTRIGGGTLFVLAPTAGAGTVTLDGGGIRFGSSDFAQTYNRNLIVTAKGGSIQTGSSGDSSNTGQWTFSGNISNDPGGAGPVALCFSNNRGFVISGDNRAFDGGFSLAMVGNDGWIQFTGVNSTGSDGSGVAPNTAAANTITVPGGVFFGFDSAATYAATIGRFATSPGSVLILNNLTATDIDLGARNIRLGSSTYTPATYAGTITPFGSTYKFTPGTAALTLGSVNQLTGARNVDVAAGEVVYGADAVIGGTLAVTAAQDYTGTTVVNGVVRNSLMGGGVVGPTLALSNNGTSSQGDLSGTSGITIDKGAVLTVAGTAANYGRITAASVPITVKGGATLNDGDNVNNNSANNSGVVNRIANGATLTLGGSTGGGSFNMGLPSAGQTHSQTLAGLTIGGGLSGFGTVNNGTGTVTLTFTGAGGAGYVRQTGGLANFATWVSFANAPTSGGGSTVFGSGGNEILVGALLGFAGDVGDFIKAQAGAVAAAAYTTQANAALWSAGQNIKTGGAVSGTVSDDLALNSLRWNVGAGTLTIAADKTLTIGSGMLAYTPNAVATITGGSLTSGNGADLIVGSNQNTLTIASRITGNLALTKFLGSGVALSNTANAIGDIYVLTGTLTSNASGALGSTSSTDTIHLFGGTLSMANSQTQNYTARKLVVGPAGGAYTDGGTAAISSLGGAIMLNGNLTVTGTGDKTLGGAIGTALGVAGGGQGTITAQTNAGRLTLSGDNQYWTGGLRVGDGMQVRLASANAAGNSVAPIVNHSAIGILEFTSGFGTSLANDIVGSAATSKTLIANAKTDGAVTLSGKIYSVGGLIFQGHDSGSAVSELVLAGTLSLSGAPDIYSYGDGTTQQRFVNAQGGINLGVTRYQTTTQLSYGTAGYLDMPTGGGGANVAVDSGAEGYVRFDGRQAFIPGAVGPGYVAALRKGSASADTKAFGYLLTGTSGGTTYRLPEGKSFVVGVLGAGTANTVTGGAFGAKGSGTATFVGNAKLAGAPAGDINVHANAAADAATLNLLADAGTTLVLGDGGNPVVFTPTWGDSGGSSAITLMRDRTGNTTLNKVGEGTLLWNNATFRDLAGTAIAAGKVTVNVKAGTLGGTGTIGGALTLQPGSKFRADLTAADPLTVTGPIVLGGAGLEIVGAGSEKSFTLIRNEGGAAVSGTFAQTRVTVGDKVYTVNYAGGESGRDVTLAIVENGTLLILR